MADRPVPKNNYKFVSSDGHNLFRERFGSLSDDEWCQLLVHSINNRTIDGVEFPTFPDSDLQNLIHGHYGESAIIEAAKFFRFVKKNTYQYPKNASNKRLLDFGCGWGRIIRPFMRDFEFSNLYGFEPNFQFCALSRTLNPYVTFFSGAFVPTDSLPYQFFDLVVGWSIFSHLSPSSATLWLREAARIIVPGGHCVFTTWGDRFLRRLKNESLARAAGKEIHWYSSVCLDAAGSIEQLLEKYEQGDFVWFTGGKSSLYGEAFIGEPALKWLISQNSLPFSVVLFDKESLGQDAFVLKRL